MKSLVRIKRSVYFFQLLFLLIQCSIFLLPAFDVLQLALMSACKVLWILRFLQRMPDIQQLKQTVNKSTRSCMQSSPNDINIVLSCDMLLYTPTHSATSAAATNTWQVRRGIVNSSFSHLTVVPAVFQLPTPPLNHNYT